MTCELSDQYAEIVKLKALAKQLAIGLEYYLNVLENGFPDQLVVVNPLPPELAAKLIAEALEP